MRVQDIWSPRKRMKLNQHSKVSKTTGMGRISNQKKYAQVLMTHEEHDQMKAHAKDCDLPNFSSWAYVVLIRELRRPVHVKRH